MSRDYSDPMFMRPLAPLVLPAVYDDVLSYEEHLAKVIHHVNELTEYINSQMTHLYENIDSYVQADVQHYMQDIINRINEVNTSLSGRIDDLQAQIDEIDTDKVLRDAKAYTDSKLAQTVTGINRDLAQLRSLISQGIVQCNQYTDNKVLVVDNKIASLDARINMEMELQFAEVNARIDNIISEFPRVYDPATGYMETIDEAIIHTFGALRVHAITALKYDDQELTAEEYDGMNIKAIKYDIDMLRILFSDLREMFNPFTGKNESVRDVVDYLIRLLKWNAKTSTEYDGYQATASEFDASTFDAYEQDTNHYLTETTPDLKNRSYRNWLFLGSGNSITVPEEMLHDESQFAVLNDDGDITYIDTVAGTYGDITITYNSGVFTITGSGIRVYSVTRVFDVSELDK